jgi:hypothetical protein
MQTIYMVPYEPNCLQVTSMHCSWIISNDQALNHGEQEVINPEAKIGKLINNLSAVNTCKEQKMHFQTRSLLLATPSLPKSFIFCRSRTTLLLMWILFLGGGTKYRYDVPLKFRCTLLSLPVISAQATHLYEYWFWWGYKKNKKCHTTVVKYT